MDINNDKQSILDDYFPKKIISPDTIIMKGPAPLKSK